MMNTKERELEQLASGLYRRRGEGVMVPFVESTSCVSRFPASYVYAIVEL